MKVKLSCSSSYFSASFSAEFIDHYSFRWVVARQFRVWSAHAEHKLHPKQHSSLLYCRQTVYEKSSTCKLTIYIKQSVKSTRMTYYSTFGEIRPWEKSCEWQLSDTGRSHDNDNANVVRPDDMRFPQPWLMQQIVLRVTRLPNQTKKHCYQLGIIKGT